MTSINNSQKSSSPIRIPECEPNPFSGLNKTSLTIIDGKPSASESASSAIEKGNNNQTESIGNKIALLGMPKEEKELLNKLDPKAKEELRKTLRLDEKFLQGLAEATLRAYDQAVARAMRNEICRCYAEAPQQLENKLISKSKASEMIEKLREQLTPLYRRQYGSCQDTITLIYFSLGALATRLFKQSQFSRGLVNANDLSAFLKQAESLASEYKENQKRLEKRMQYINQGGRLQKLFRTKAEKEARASADLGDETPTLAKTEEKALSLYEKASIFKESIRHFPAHNSSASKLESTINWTSRIAVELEYNLKRSLSTTPNKNTSPESSSEENLMQRKICAHFLSLLKDGNKHPAMAQLANLQNSLESAPLDQEHTLNSIIGEIEGIITAASQSRLSKHDLAMFRMCQMLDLDTFKTLGIRNADGHVPACNLLKEIIGNF